MTKVATHSTPPFSEADAEFYLPADAFFRANQPAGLTYDDVSLATLYSEILPKDADTSTQLSEALKLQIPIISSDMDTVTESRLAISMAQEGGIGILHKNMGVEDQAREVRLVKKFESGVVRDPITVSPETRIGQLIELTRINDISGVPVVKGRELVGIVTSRDLRFETRYDLPVSQIMTPKDKLVTAKEGASTDEIKSLLHKYRIEKVLLVDDSFNLTGMVTNTDLLKAEAFPNSCKDEHGRLRVGAAVGTGAGTEERVAALIEAGVYVLIVDTAHGHSQGVLDRIKWVVKNFPEAQIIGGNIATADAALALAEAGVHGVKVGIGPGSICTTRIVAGIGVPQISAIANVVAALDGRDIPVIADGGIRYSGDIAKAIAAGAHSIMVGSLLAGTEEAPGEVELYQGRYYKAYRGMGSLGAMAQTQGSSDRYFQDASHGVEKLVPEGIEGRVPYKGPMSAIVHQMMGGVRSSMGYTGCKTIEDMRTKPSFVRITSAGIKESHVHDVSITKEAPNYRING